MKIIEEKQQEEAQLKKDMEEKQASISRMKERVMDYTKLEQKCKIVESKHVYEMSLIKN